MAVRKTVALGDPRLKAKNKVVRNINSPKVKKIIKDLIDTMRDADLVGMAAPQIGENYKIFITEPRKTKARKNVANDKLRIFINPKLVKKSKKEHVIWEGCGCTGDIFGPVKRPKTVTVEAVDEEGKKFQMTADGLLGRIFLHEMDHLSGKEFLQRIDDNSKLARKDYYIKNIRNSKVNVENSKITIMEYKKL